ncbi:MAG: hypothetical protein Q8M31_06280 [Beijerinckiaceae bacterium]|nr:hypothetical protein [Beijerinckiaceae bacterium]
MKSWIAPFLAAVVTAFIAAPGRATENGCEEKACDEQQIGPYVAPDIEPPNLEGRFDPRGKAVPIPGLDGMVVRHRPGAGVWLGEAPGKANVFLKPRRERVTVDVKVDF